MLGTGESLALLSGLSYAVANVSIAKSASRGGGDNGALLSIIVTVLLAFIVWLSDITLHSVRVSYIEPAGLAWFAIAGLLTIVLGRAFFFQSVARIGAIRASAVNRLNPFFSVLVAATILGESISTSAQVGMGLIALSFLIVIRNALYQWKSLHSAIDTPSLSAYSFGAASALSYAFGYTARRFGLDVIPDANFGTLVGAATSLLIYCMIAIFSDHYRAALLRIFDGTTRWHLMAAGCISVGQISQFAAISYIEVSRVVMITSCEIFLSIILSLYVVRTERQPDGLTLIGAIVAAIGVVLIAYQ